MKPLFIYLGYIILLATFFQCDMAKSPIEEEEKSNKIENTNIGIAQFESVNLEEGRHESGLNRIQDQNGMTYTWSRLSRADTYLFELYKNGEVFKSIRTATPKVSLKMNEFRGFQRGDEIEARVSSIYGRGKPVFTRIYRATSLAVGGQRMLDGEAVVQNPKQIRYEWQPVEGADQYRFTLAIQAAKSEEIVEVVDTTIAETSFSFVLDHLNKFDQIQTSVEPLQSGQSLKAPEVAIALYANGIARHDIVLLAKAGSTITKNALEEMTNGESCRPTNIAFEEGTYTTDQGEITLAGKQYETQIYQLESLINCLDSTNNFMTCLQTAIPLLPDVVQHNCTYDPVE